MYKYVEEKEIDYEKLSLVEFQDIMSDKYESLLIDKRTKNYQILKNDYNKLVIIYNTRAKQRIYNKIK